MADYVVRIFKSFTYVLVAFGVIFLFIYLAYFVGYLIQRWNPAFLSDVLRVQLVDDSVFGSRFLIGAMVVVCGGLLYAWLHCTGEIICLVFKRIW